ncbi:MAG: HD domain-containing protein [bacterium]|nr:HD domain-containing protein [bacterium]
MDSFSQLSSQNKALERSLRSVDMADDRDIQSAWDLAADAHSGQRRDEGAEYIVHPVRVARILIDDFHVHDPNLIIAALLHDVVEDTRVTIDDIRKKYNAVVVRLVDMLTRRRPDNESEEEKQVNKIIKFQKLMNADYDVRLVKCADILDNVRSWPRIPTDHPSQHKFPRWFQEAQEWYIPLARSVGPRAVVLMEKAVADGHGYYEQKST